ncbi:PQQ-like beta-propeller repeat protein [Haematobacter missouriensis]|uniref:Quinoprotein n=1 Tax=Haematobacter missouriensis TaxID=366616 RepID=A0A225D0N7_9RHOB|nr:quinoprotein [Haematobacter missouriensis]OWJ86637.1 quinoprotein [Haematobacter missouriensis]
MLKRSIGILALAALATACSKPEERLPGERIDIRDTISGYHNPRPANEARPASLPAQSVNAEWTQPGGNAAHRLGNPALARALTPIWSASIGQGDSERRRITAEPVVAGGRIYTLDAAMQVVATSTSGQTLWSKSVLPRSGAAGTRSGGGLATADGRLYVTTAYGDLVALDAASGAELWRQRFDAPAMGAPAVAGNRIYVVARDSSAWALDTSGKVLWTLPGTPSISGVMGGSAPAVGEGMVIFPFASGNLIAVTQGSGASLWEAAVAGKRVGRAWSGFTDITSDPVIAGNTVYAGNQSGGTVALDARTGDARWTAREGSYGPVAVSGNAVYLVNDEAKLVRLDSATGAPVWVRDLPFFVPQKEKRRAEIFVHYGPLLAGGRLLLVSSDGVIRSFDPASGTLIGSQELPDGAAAAPAIAGGTLYVVTRDGQLRAFR